MSGKMVEAYLVYFPRCVGYANSVMSIGEGWTTSIEPIPTSTLAWSARPLDVHEGAYREKTNIPYCTEAA